MKAKRPDARSRAAMARARKLRLRRGWSAQRLADEVTGGGLLMHRATVAALETGDRQMTVDELCALAVALNVAPAVLIGDGTLCERCNDSPPPGFACLECGATSDEKGVA